MPNEIVVIISSILGIIVGAIANYLSTRRRVEAEIEKLRADADKARVEADRMRAETIQPAPPVRSDNGSNVVISRQDGPSGKFVKMSEREFLDGIDLSKVRRLFVLGHTGRRIYDAVHERLEGIIQDGVNFPEEIQILIRTPFVESLSRNKYIHNTIVEVGALKLKGKNIDVRFYESVPAVRGMICEFHTDDRTSYITSYYWPKPNESKAFDSAYVIKDSIASQRLEVRLLESWIRQYWGRDEIHTVVFDFDDTLVSTGEIQVKAWAQVIDDFLGRGVIKAENLSSRLQGFVNRGESIIGNPALLDAIRSVFIDKQLAEAIVQDLIIDVKDETIKRINEKRFKFREDMMDQARLFDGVAELIDRLHAHYNFAITSSTDEQMISKYLYRRGLLKYFPVILGKKDPSLKLERDNIHHKTSLLIKLSEIIGMPLGRLVYIGDNNSDYLATRQLGIDFIEARQAARLMGQESFVGTIDSRKPPLGYFESFEGDQLPSLLSQHSQKIAERKYQV